jgi:hypothetical protein
MAKTQTTFETATPTPAFPDFTKIDFTKIQADFGKWFGDYSKTFANGKAGLFDFEGVVAAQKKNFEVLTAANQAAFEGVKAVAQRQAEIARKAVEEFGKVAKETGRAGQRRREACEAGRIDQGRFRAGRCQCA